MEQEIQSNQEEDNQDIGNQEDAGHNYCTQEKCKAKNKTKNKTNNNINNYCTANFCIVCGINMGDENPRQLCRKTYCPDETY